MNGYLKPVTARAPRGANNIFIQKVLRELRGNYVFNMTIYECCKMVFNCPDHSKGQLDHFTAQGLMSFYSFSC